MTRPILLQVVEELLAYWKLEDADDLLEELEEVLIVIYPCLLPDLLSQAYLYKIKISQAGLK